MPENDTGDDRPSDQGDRADAPIDAYFCADVETDGPIPGPYSMLAFALVYAGHFDGNQLIRPKDKQRTFYRELQPISPDFQAEAMRVNGLDRAKLFETGVPPQRAMTDAFSWTIENAGAGRPVLVAYPLSFDWTWLYWYFMKYSSEGSPFDYSRCFDIKTAFAVKARRPISASGRAQLLSYLKSARPHTHHALDDALEHRDIFWKVFDWRQNGRTSPSKEA